MPHDKLNTNDIDPEIWERVQRLRSVPLHERWDDAASKTAAFISGNKLNGLEHPLSLAWGWLEHATEIQLKFIPGDMTKGEALQAVADCHRGPETGWGIANYALISQRVKRGERGDSATPPCRPGFMNETFWDAPAGGSSLREKWEQAVVVLTHHVSDTWLSRGAIAGAVARDWLENVADCLQSGAQPKTKQEAVAAVAAEYLTGAPDVLLVKHALMEWKMGK